ncbi:hypothetical protein Tco_1580455, partial [Tanacetum coccineum]
TNESPKNLVEYYYKKLTFNTSDEEVTSKVKTHKKRKRDARSMSAEELVAWVPMTLKELEIPMSVDSPAGSTANVPDEELEVDVAGLVANNAVGAEGPYSPKFVPDFALSDEACKTLSGATTKGQRP